MITLLYIYPLIGILFAIQWSDDLLFGNVPSGISDEHYKYVAAIVMMVRTIAWPYHLYTIYKSSR